MELEAVKEYAEARPFRAFQLVLPNDRRLEVPHPEFIALSESGASALVWDKRGKRELVDVRLVVSIKEDAASVQ